MVELGSLGLCAGCRGNTTPRSGTSLPEGCGVTFVLEVSLSREEKQGPLHRCPRKEGRKPHSGHGKDSIVGPTSGHEQARVSTSQELVQGHITREDRGTWRIQMATAPGATRAQVALGPGTCMCACDSERG